MDARRINNHPHPSPLPKGEGIKSQTKKSPIKGASFCNTNGEFEALGFSATP